MTLHGITYSVFLDGRHIFIGTVLYIIPLGMLCLTFDLLIGSFIWPRHKLWWISATRHWNLHQHFFWQKAFDIKKFLCWVFKQVSLVRDWGYWGLNDNVVELKKKTVKFVYKIAEVYWCSKARILSGDILPSAIHQIHWYCLFQMDLSEICLDFLIAADVGIKPLLWLTYFLPDLSWPGFFFRIRLYQNSHAFQTDGTGVAEFGKLQVAVHRR